MELMTGEATGPVQAQPKARRPHRPRKDYTNLDTVFDSLDELKTALRRYMDNATAADGLPQYVSCAMVLSAHTLLPLKSPLEGPYAHGGPNYVPFGSLGNDSEFDDNTSGNGLGHDEHGGGGQLAYKSVLELVNIDDLKQRQIWQRAAAKGVVHQIQDLDGFKYCFNNNWSSKDDNGYRYSYTCLDSLENKDRHANGFRATNAATRRPGANTRGVRKPTYDCKGQIAVKFSGLRQSVEVVYKHHAIHKTVAERRPPPRKDSKRKSIADPESNPDGSLLSFADSDPHDTSFMFPDADSAEYHPYPEPVEPSPPPPPPKKAPRKSKDGAQPRQKRQKPQPPEPFEQQQQQQERPLSLVEILQQSMTASDAAPSSVHEPLAQPSPPPIWHSPVTAPPVAPSQALAGHHASLAARTDYPSPYQQPQPRDVGRFSKLAVPCFKCKAAQTQCDGRQPVCNSCHVRGTVCNYPSILRFDKTPVPDTRWIQVQPTQQGRGVFRINQAPAAANPSTTQPTNAFLNASSQQNSWFSQQ